VLGKATFTKKSCHFTHPKNKLMKKLFYSLLTVIMLLSSSCKKDKPAATEPKSQWKVGENSYKGYAKSYPWVSNFSATDSIGQYGIANGNYIAIDFYFGHMPTKSGTYTVRGLLTDTTQCRVTASNTNTGSTDYTSVDATSEVSITVSSAGKLTASFSGIVLSNNTNTKTKTASGVLVEQ
jgi:hypothetical protein